MLFDISDPSMADKTLRDLYGLSEKDLEAITQDELNEIADSNSLHQKPQGDVRIKVCHITTSGNSCFDIRTHGLLCPAEVLKRDTELSRFFKDNLGMSLSADGKLFMGGEELDPRLYSRIINKIESDNRINGYAFIGSAVDGYDKRPEITEDAASVFSMPSLVSKWGIGKATYAVWFEVSVLFDVCNVGELYVEHRFDGLRDYYRGLLNLAYSVASGECARNIPVCLILGKQIDAEKLTVCPIDCLCLEKNNAR